MRFWKKKRVHPPLSDIFVLSKKSILEKKIYLDPRQNGMDPKHWNNKKEWIQSTAKKKPFEDKESCRVGTHSNPQHRRIFQRIGQLSPRGQLLDRYEIRCWLFICSKLCPPPSLYLKITFPRSKVQVSKVLFTKLWKINKN